MLSVCKSDKRIDEYINSSKVLSVLSKEQIENIKEKLNFDKFGSLSFKAMREIIPFCLKEKDMMRRVNLQGLTIAVLSKKR